MNSDKKIKELYFGVILLVISTTFSLAIFEWGCRLIYPDGFYSWRPNPTKHVTSEFSYSVFRNSWGVRDKEFKPEELKGENIILLGDSMTYGQGVENKDTFAKLLDIELRDRGHSSLVINGGGRGTSTVRQFMSLKELSKDVDFAAVGFCFYLGNDSDNNFQHADQPESMRSAIERELSTNSIRKWFFQNSALVNFAYMRLRSLAYSLNLIKSFQMKEQLVKDSSSRVVEGWKITDDYVSRIKEYQVENPETHIFFVLLPQDFQVDTVKQERYDLTPESYDFLKPNRTMRSILERHQLPYVDVTQAFVERYAETKEENLFFPIDRHFTEAGHLVVAEEIARYFATQDVLKLVEVENSPQANDLPN